MLIQRQLPSNTSPFTVYYAQTLLETAFDCWLEMWPKINEFGSTEVIEKVFVCLLGWLVKILFCFELSWISGEIRKLGDPVILEISPGPIRWGGCKEGESRGRRKTHPRFQPPDPTGPEARGECRGHLGALCVCVGGGAVCLGTYVHQTSLCSMPASDQQPPNVLASPADHFDSEAFYWQLTFIERLLSW